MEIELKLVCEPDAVTAFENKVVPILKAKNIVFDKSSANLYNEYFDTPDEFFGQRKMGFRVRAKNNNFEQTIKTKGNVVGGLHQRPEYNIALKSNTPDLTLFDSDIWAEKLDLEQINKALSGLFLTNFDRTTFLVKNDEFIIEIVFDLGEVRRAQDYLPICEIELELVKGDPSHLYNIAELIVENLPTRLSDVTKAARGYQLLHGSILESKYLPSFLSLEKQDSTEQAFCKMLEIGLRHWQHHQQVYLQTSKLKALTQIREAISLLLQGVALYLPTLQCKELLGLHKDLLKLAQAWAWQEQLQSIHQLRSKKGPFSKRIPKSQNLMNYLMGRREGLLNAFKPQQLCMSTISSNVQLAISRALYEKPWKIQNSGADTPVIKHANGWLSQTWQTVQQSLPSNSKMDDKQYLALEVLLRQSLINGFLLADLFAESRGQFRAPWLDLATGIQELKSLKLLHDSSLDIQVDDRAEFVAWIEDKTHSVIKVMEQSREVAMNADIYW